MQTAEILPLLPDVLRQGAGEETPLGALLAAMSALHERDERILAQLDAYFDPWRAPDAFLPYLASWVDLGWVPIRGDPAGVGVAAPQLRRLIAAAPRLAQLRGTVEGLTLLLRTATAEAGIVVVDSGAPGGDVSIPFHLEVRIPAEAAAARPLVESLVRDDKPAHVTCAVVVTGAPSPTTE
jgi:phage tail-like protein